MEYAIIFIILAIVVAIQMKVDERKRDDEVNKIFKGRDSLSPDEFYEKYYSGRVPKHIVIEIIKILELDLDTELSRLRPEDDFSNNLRYLFETDSMAGVEVIELIEHEFSIKISDDEAESIKTIDDLILFVNDRASCT